MSVRTFAYGLACGLAVYGTMSMPVHLWSEFWPISAMNVAAFISGCITARVVTERGER